METSASRPTIRPSLAVYRRIALTFVALTILVVAAVFYVIFLRAEVVVLSEAEEVKSEVVIDVSRSAQAGSIPGSVVTSEETATRTFPSTSVVRVRLPAKGSVRIASTLYRPQTLVASTRLESADGTLYRLVKGVTVPGFGNVTAEVYADDPGKPVPEGDAISFTIPGLNEETRKFFTVTSVGPLGGEEKDVRMVTAGDLNVAEEVLREQMADELKTSVREEAKQRGLAMGGELVTIDTASRTSDVAIGADADGFTLTVTARATAIYYDDARLRDTLMEKMRETISYDKVLRSIEEGTMQVDVLRVDAAKGTATLSVEARGTATLSPDAPSLAKEKVLGVSKDAAREYLESVEGVASASVTLRPWFAWHLPSVPEHVTVEVR